MIKLYLKMELEFDNYAIAYEGNNIGDIIDKVFPDRVAVITKTESESEAPSLFIYDTIADAVEDIHNDFGDTFKVVKVSYVRTPQDGTLIRFHLDNIMNVSWHIHQYRLYQYLDNDSFHKIKDIIESESSD